MPVIVLPLLLTALIWALSWPPGWRTGRVNPARRPANGRRRRAWATPRRRRGVAQLIDIVRLGAGYLRPLWSGDRQTWADRFVGSTVVDAPR